MKTRHPDFSDSRGEIDTLSFSTPRWAQRSTSPRLGKIFQFLFAVAASGYLALRGSRIIATSAATSAVSNGDIPITRPVICNTPECIHAASQILYTLDSNYKSIDPCNDFDQYVCGGWRELHDMRPDQSSIFAGTIMAENVQMRLRHILDSPEVPKDYSSILLAADSDNFEKLKSAYRACMDVPKLNERGSKPLEEILDLVDHAYEKARSDHDLTEVITYLTSIGVEALTALSVSPDDRDPDSVVIFNAVPRKIGLPVIEFYNQSNIVQDYTSVVLSVLSKFDIHVLGQSPLRVAKNVVLFESKLANITPDSASLRDVTAYYNPMSVEQVDSLLPQVSISKIIAALAPQNFKAGRIIVGSPRYLEDLSKILEKTPKGIIRAFFKWKVIQAYAAVIEDPKITAIREFDNRMAGKDPQATEERWRKCVGSMDKGLGWLLSRFYVLDAFTEESKKLGDQIVSDIKERFIYTLDQTKWMSAEVRQLGKQKVVNIVQEIGYPTKSPNLMDAEDVKNYYKELDVKDDTYFENALRMTKFSAFQEWSKLGKPTNRDEWEMTAPTVNAYYNPHGNEIFFPAGVMQPIVFYGPNAPLFLTYGAFGAVGGHELSHAFDSSGRLYDDTGNYTDWWDEKTIQAFEERAQCFVDQYEKFTVPGPDPDSEPLHVNGRLTLSENIADAGGLSAAYHAWKKREDTKSDPQLPGLDGFSKEQLFFISYASFWCGKTTKEAAISSIYNNPHPPKPARIMGTMANSREFRTAFNCPQKEPTCSLWW